MCERLGQQALAASRLLELTAPAAAAAGGLLSNGQQWGTQYVQQVQQKVGWFTGGYLNSYFNISSAYGGAAAGGSWCRPAACA
jgi:hypothetical protein